MSTAVTFLMGVIVGGIAGWMLCSFNVEFEKVRRQDRILRDIQDRAERERMT